MEIDWIEAETARLLQRAKRSQFFESIISDAKWIESMGYVWDVALSKACELWLSPLPPSRIF